MADFEAITENIRRLRRDIEAELDNTSSSQIVTSTLVEKLADLRRRAAANPRAEEDERPPLK
jgi:selenocysteine lyase/cysteine desulfurase